MAMRYRVWLLRPSSQSCSLVSHCSSSPQRARRARQLCTCSTRARRSFHNPASISHFRSVSLPTFNPCSDASSSPANVGTVIVPLLGLLVLAKQPYGSLLHPCRQLSIRGPSPQPMHHRTVSFQLHPLQQCPHPPRADPS